MKKMMLLVLLCTALLHSQGASASAASCQGRFVNPITDVCWSCLFPITLGSVTLFPGKMKDTPNPASPIQICPMGIFYRVGLAIGFWEPMGLTDVTRSPFCMTSLGGFTIDVAGARGEGVGDQRGTTSRRSWYRTFSEAIPMAPPPSPGKRCIPRQRTRTATGCCSGENVTASIALRQQHAEAAVLPQSGPGYRRG